MASIRGREDMARTAGLLVLLALAAGCSEPASDGVGPDPGPAVPDEATQEAPVEPEPPARKGAVRCVTVDAALHPVVGVNVRLEPGGRNVTSGEFGSCYFSDVDAGSYIVSAEKDGYRSTQVGIDVDPREQAPVNVRLVMEPSLGPGERFFTWKWDGFVAWSAAAAGYGYSYWDFLGGTMRDVHLSEFPDENASWIQFEVAWRPSTDLSQRMALDSTISARDADRSTATTNIYERRTAQYTEGDGFIFQAYNATQVGPGKVWLTADFEAARTSPLQVGFAVQQPFEAFVSMFWNVEPRPGWLFTRDGEYKP
jgi:hypothetical protein